MRYQYSYECIELDTAGAEGGGLGTDSKCKHTESKKRTPQAA